jgi:hypothetical protein
MSISIRWRTEGQEYNFFQDGVFFCVLVKNALQVPFHGIDEIEIYSLEMRRQVQVRQRMFCIGGISNQSK